MRRGIIIGIFLGFLLTVGGAYSYDALTAGVNASNVSSDVASEQRPMVNWDVVSRRVSDLHAGLVEMGNRVQDGWRKLTG